MEILPLLKLKVQDLMGLKAEFKKLLFVSHSST